MADGLSIKVQGLKELDQALKQIGPKLARKGLRAAANSGAQVIKREALQLVPVRTGRLKKAIYVKRIRLNSNNLTEAYTIGVRVGRKEAKKNRDAYYWFLQEFGTVHNAAQPFIRPAFERRKEDAVEAFKIKLGNVLKTLVKQV